MAKVSEYKKKIVQDIVKLVKQYPMVGVVNMENLPAPQLQSMRAELRGKIDLFMTKKRLMRIAIEKVKNEKKGIEELENYFHGMPALIFTKDSPFRLSRILQKSKTSAPAKAGQTAPSDIVIPKGPTPFAPGPIISELSQVGLKVGVESGKVAVKEDSIIVKKGDKIKPKVAEVLTRLDIKPMEVGLGMVAAYENGIIYQKEVLEVDEKEFNNKVNNAALQAFNLAFNLSYTTKENIALLLGKAFNDAKALGLSRNVIDEGIVGQLLGNAERSMLGLKNAANIETAEKPKEKVEEKKSEEKKKEKKQEEPKEAREPEQQVTEIPKEKTEEKRQKHAAKEEVEKPVEKEKVKEKQPEIKEVKKEEKRPEVREEVQIKKEAAEQKAPQKKQEQVSQESKQEAEVSGEEDIYERKGRDELVAEGEISPAEEGFMEGYEEAGKTKDEKKEEEKPMDDTDRKIKELVEKTKKFMGGKEEKAQDIIEEVKKEEDRDLKEKMEGKKEIKKQEVPSLHDLKKQKEEKEKKEVEDLTKELLRKGTLRKK